jgi:hypothetical protein
MLPLCCPDVAAVKSLSRGSRPRGEGVRFRTLSAVRVVLRPTGLPRNSYTVGLNRHSIQSGNFSNPER